MTVCLLRLSHLGRHTQLPPLLLSLQPTCHLLDSSSGGRGYQHTVFARFFRFFICLVCRQGPNQRHVQTVAEVKRASTPGSRIRRRWKEKSGISTPCSRLQSENDYAASEPWLRILILTLLCLRIGAVLPRRLQKKKFKTRHLTARSKQTPNTSTILLWPRWGLSTHPNTIMKPVRPAPESRSFRILASYRQRSAGIAGTFSAWKFIRNSVRILAYGAVRVAADAPTHGGELAHGSSTRGSVQSATQVMVSVPRGCTAGPRGSTKLLLSVSRGITTVSVLLPAAIC